MTAPPSPAERFLAAFHDQRPGGTSAAYGVLPADCGGALHPSSYHCLAATVPPTATTVLDLACGDGHLLALLRQQLAPTCQLLGADFSAGELAQARQRLGAGAELSLCRAQQLPFATASIDQVLCHMALMLMDELDAVLAEVLRVLVPAGRLAFVVGARPPPQPVYEHYIQRLLAWRTADPSRMLNFGDRRLRDEASIHALLSPQFRAIEVNTITLHRRRTPAQVWDWVEGMYDLHLAPPDQCLALKADFMADLQALCEADGCLPQTDVLNRVVATAA